MIAKKYQLPQNALFANRGLSEQQLCRWPARTTDDLAAIES